MSHLFFSLNIYLHSERTEIEINPNLVHKIIRQWTSKILAFYLVTNNVWNTRSSDTYSYSEGLRKLTGVNMVNIIAIC